MTEIDVAEGWERLRAKFLFRKLQLPPPEDSGTVTAFRDGEVTLRENRRAEGYTFATKEIGYQGVRPGDLVIHAMDAFAGAIGVSDSHGKCSPVYSVCEPRRELDVRYYAYLLRDLALSGRIASLTQGIRERSTDFRFNVFGELRLPYFDVDHQRAIASFLDGETARIDTLIEKKRRLLDLLEEKRTALITRAVIRGLDPDVPMKDSGVEWIGEIPEHWEVVQVRRLLRRMEQGWSPQCENRQAEVGEWGVLKAGCVNGGVFSEYEHKVLPATEMPKPELEVGAGDVLMSRASGSPALIGSAAYVAESRGALMLSDKIFRLHTVDHLVEGEFLALALGARPVRAQIEQAISGAGGLANNISQASVRELQIALPPRLEQLEIVEYVRARQRQLRKAENEVSKAVPVLEEYKTALISTAVGGQISVTEAEGMANG